MVRNNLKLCHTAMLTLQLLYIAPRPYLLTPLLKSPFTTIHLFILCGGRRGTLYLLRCWWCSYLSLVGPFHKYGSVEFAIETGV